MSSSTPQRFPFLLLLMLVGAVLPSVSLAQPKIEQVSIRNSASGEPAARLRIALKLKPRILRKTRNSRRPNRVPLRIHVRQSADTLGTVIDSRRKRARIRGKKARLSIRQKLYAPLVEIQVAASKPRALAEPQWSEPISVYSPELDDESDSSPEIEQVSDYQDPVLSAGVEQCAEEIIQLAIFWTNEARIANGAAPLSEHLLVRYAALQKADQMASTGHFAHAGWLDFMLAQFSLGRFGNNIAMYYTDPQELIEAFGRSPGHFMNMINPAYSYIGIGCVVKDGITYWSQNFYGQ